MRTILVTGSKGFLGRNLVHHLARRDDLRILGADVDTPESELRASAEAADFVFHLAGVNRPKDPADFGTGNAGTVRQLAEFLTRAGRRTPVLLSSSIQAELGNPYGASKREAEELLFAYAAGTGAPVYAYRLPNLFGKWSRPNYNTVIATWCHNIARGLPVQVDDREKVLDLAYVDDVVESFLAAMDGAVSPDADGYCRVPVTYRRTLGQIADLLALFDANRKTLVVPSFEDPFVRKLYGTWLSFLPTDGFSYPLETKRDDRGWLAEFIKSASFGQVFVSRTEPGVTRGNHWHHTKAEKFLVVSGEGVVRFRQVDGHDVVEYPVSGDEPRVVDIPTGYTHSISNTGTRELITIFWSDEIFDPAKADTHYLGVDA